MISDDEVIGFEVVVGLYESLNEDSGVQKWISDFHSGNANAADLVKSFSDFFFETAKGQEVKFEVMLMMGRHCAQISPLKMNTHEDKKAFCSILPRVIKDICEKCSDSPLMAMMVFDAWSCLLTKSCSEEIAKNTESKDSENKIRASVFSSVLDKWGSIGNVPSNHSKVCRFDTIVHLSFFNNKDGPTVVARQSIRDKSILKLIDQEDADNLALPMITHKLDGEGVLRLDTEGFEELMFDSSSL